MASALFLCLKIVINLTAIFSDSPYKLAFAAAGSHFNILESFRGLKYNVLYKIFIGSADL